METKDTPEWLYNSEKYKAGITEIPSESDIPDTSEISNLDDLQNIIDICKEWRYNNEGRPYPIDVYIYCLLEKNQVKKIAKSEYPDIHEMLTGEGREPIELFKPIIAMAILDKTKISRKSIRWVNEIVPVEMNYTWKDELILHERKFETNFIFNIGLYSQKLNFEFEFNDESIDYDWGEFKNVVFDLEKNFMEYVKTYQMMTERKLNIEKSTPQDEFVEEYRDTIEDLEYIRRKFRTTFRDKEFDFFVDLENLFSFNKMKTIVDDIKLTNILVYHFIVNLATFIRKVEKFS